MKANKTDNDYESDDESDNDNESVGSEYSEVDNMFELSDTKTSVLEDVKWCPQSGHYEIIKNSHELVPNFLGGALPRRDGPNKQYYAATILALFKPWRSGLDLKEEGQEWHASFEQFTLSSQQQELMNNFMIKHECVDSLDDFHTQQKLEDEKDQLGLNLPLEDIDANEYFNDNIINADFNQIDPESLTCYYETPDRNTMRRWDVMLRTEERLLSSGWIGGYIGDAICALSLTIANSKGPKEWLKIVNDIQSKMKEQSIPHNINQLPSGSNVVKGLDHYNIPGNSEGNVIIVDHAKQIEVSSSQIMDDEPCHKEKDSIIDVADLFNLNDEQKRAFMIIALHLHSTGSDQLKMYLGGMTGTGKSQVIKAVAHYFDHHDSTHVLELVAPQVVLQH
ncbi:hypothetical protein M422DRAFT_256341 [Sphaerobolus stellatus SS14]|uniref:DNA helicase n=1 Tax=Sphaerobolus stellatus (strain SS14) TaxID=990650 RepID=A0A0C9VGU2_SPHS4|nr:hypothetical protein M422DRAFT_256341 [Sphaerobolus stellatus SS14]